MSPLTYCYKTVCEYKIGGLLIKSEFKRFFKKYYREEFSKVKIIPADIKFRHYRLELFSKRTFFLRLKDVFNVSERLRQAIVQKTPKNAYFTPVKWLNPIYTGKSKKELDVMLSFPLYFDVDTKLLSKPTFLEAKKNTIKLVEFIEDRFERTPDLILFSGSQGFHVHYWVWDSLELFRLTPSARITEFKKSRMKILSELKRQEIIVDETVTGDPYRILKIPHSLHGTTGLIAMPVDDLYKFRPERDALAFPEEIYSEELDVDLNWFLQ